MMGPMFYGSGGLGGFGWLGMGLGMVIQLGFWILIIYVAVRLVRGVTLGKTGEDGNYNVVAKNKFTAKEILKQRYARGEITREQYHEIAEEIKE